MKQFYASILGGLLCCTSLFAQIPNCNAPIPYNRLAYDMLKNLDKTQIPTGALYESVYPWGEVEFYDGTSTTDTSSFPHFIQAYSELYNSTFNRINLAHPSDYETAIKNFHPDIDFHHPIGIIDYQFNTIDPMAVTNNLLSVSNNQLFDIPNRPNSPYITKNTFIGTALLANNIATLYEGTHYFHFSPDFILSNTGFDLNNVENIEIQLDGVTVLDQAVSGINNAVFPVIISPVNNVKTLVIVTIIIRIAGVNILNKIMKTLFFKDTKYQPSPCKDTDKILVEVDAIGIQYGRNSYKARGIGTIFYADGN